MTLETAAATGRRVPFDEAAEQHVLGCLLTDRDAIFKIADLLRVDDFYLARHQRVYAAAQALLERRERIDPITIQVELARREELDRAGGQAYLRSLADGVPTAVEIERHAHVVRDRAILRRLLGAATAIAADAYDEPTDIPLALDRAEQRPFALRDQSANAQLRHIAAAAAAALHGLPILIDDTPGISVMELRTKARRASTHEKVDVIVVDYLQLVRTGGEDENRVQEIATITRNLKALARELDVVIIGLSQLSRAAGDAGGEPKLSTLREGGSREQDSDLVSSLSRA